MKKVLFFALVALLFSCNSNSTEASTEATVDSLSVDSVKVDTTVAKDSVKISE
jgi:hypothetical protein